MNVVQRFWDRITGAENRRAHEVVHALKAEHELDRQSWRRQLSDERAKVASLRASERAAWATRKCSSKS